MPQLILIAHRGGLYYRPENSFTAFEHSISLGAEWVECDIRLSRDLVPVVHHDDRISLPTGGDKGVRELDHNTLAKMDIGGGESVPVLKEVLHRFGRKLCINLELKELDAVEKVIHLILDMGLVERVIISSFIPEAIQLSRDIAPEIPRGLLVDRLTGRIVGPKSAVKAGAMFRCEYFLPHYSALSADWVSAAKNEGMKVLPWTVNRLDDGKRLIDLGVDGLVSDRIDQFFPLLPHNKQISY